MHLFAGGCSIILITGSSVIVAIVIVIVINIVITNIIRKLPYYSGHNIKIEMKITSIVLS